MERHSLSSLTMADRYDVRRYVQAWNQVLAVFADRGIATEDVQKTERDFATAVQEGQAMVGAKFPRDQGNAQLVLLHLGAKLTIKTAQRIAEEIDGQRTLIVYQSTITPQARALLADTHVVELVEEAEWLRLAKPEHLQSVVQLENSEKQQFLELFGITEDMVPEEKEDSMLARYFGLLPGDIAKVTEQREGRKFITFRRIIAK